MSSKSGVAIIKRSKSSDVRHRQPGIMPFFTPLKKFNKVLNIDNPYLKSPTADPVIRWTVALGSIYGFPETLVPFITCECNLITSY